MDISSTIFDVSIQLNQSRYCITGLNVSRYGDISIYCCISSMPMFISVYECVSICLYVYVSICICTYPYGYSSHNKNTNHTITIPIKQAFKNTKYLAAA